MKRYVPSGKLLQTPHRNDCAAHALAACLPEMGYDWAMEQCMHVGYDPNVGTWSHLLIEQVNANLHSSRPKMDDAFMLVPDSRDWRGKSLANLVETYPVGVFYVVIFGHAIALVNGEVVDTTTRYRQPGATIRACWVLTDSWVGNRNAVYSTVLPNF